VGRSRAETDSEGSKEATRASSAPNRDFGSTISAEELLGAAFGTWLSTVGRRTGRGTRPEARVPGPAFRGPRPRPRPRPASATRPRDSVLTPI